LIAANNGLALTLLSTFGVDPAAVNQAVDQILPTAGGTALTNYVNAGLLASLEIDFNQLRRAVEREQQNQPNKPSGTDDPVSTVKEDHDRGRVGCGERIRDLLVAAGARARGCGAAVIEVSDVLLTVIGDEQAAAALAGLGVDVITLRSAIEQRDTPDWRNLLRTGWRRP
jgi:hypothetical protein